MTELLRVGILYIASNNISNKPLSRIDQGNIWVVKAIWSKNVVQERINTLKTNNNTFKKALLSTGSIAIPVLTGMLIGGAVGAVATLLFAPHSGKLTRAEIQYKAIELRDQTQKTVSEAMLKARSKANELKEIA